jgi:hypothetical protein
MFQFLFFLLFIRSFISSVKGSIWIVAASNSSPEAKARANVVCTGNSDQKILYQSMRLGPWTKTEYDDNAWTYAYSAQSVEWLPGDYYLSDTLYISQAVDSVLHAEGAILHYFPTTGDAVVVAGCLRCRYYFGTIWSNSSGGALAFKDRPYSNPFMPNLMNIFNFQGLQQTIPDGKRGIGLWLTKHFCVNKVEGTDIRGFRVGVYVDDTGEGKVDTNWYWLSYVRGCGQDIVVTGNGVDSQQWFVNVDATLPGSVAIRTAARFERWQIIMGTLDRSPSTRSIILDPGAQYNWLEITPPIYMFDGYENNSNEPTNVFVQVPSHVGRFYNSTHSKSHVKKPRTQTHLVHRFDTFVDGNEMQEVKKILRGYKDLYAEGLITLEEYEQKKKQILDSI